jgi:hypothetical protein
MHRLFGLPLVLLKEWSPSFASHTIIIASPACPVNAVIICFNQDSLNLPSPIEEMV